MERCCQDSVSDGSGPWKLTPSTHHRAVQITWTIRPRYGHRYVYIYIFRTVSVSNGRRLTGLRELRIEYENKVLYTCSPTGSTVGAARRRLAAKWTSRRRWINLPCQQKKKGCQISVNKRNQALAERIERIGNDLWLMDGAISFMTCSYVMMVIGQLRVK